MTLSNPIVDPDAAINRLTLMTSQLKSDSLCFEEGIIEEDKATLENYPPPTFLPLKGFQKHS